MQALDELVARWRKNPDSESTQALCAHLGTSQKSDLMREVGNAADAWHRDNHPVMLSVGRMYLDAGLLAEAQAAFVQAGKLLPNDSEAYRFLGEVLLRRGDAVRGEKAIARAIKLGDSDATTRLWHERSVVYSALQQRRGMRAVADEVARTAPLQPSIPVPTLNPFEPAPPRVAQRGNRRSRPPAGPARPSGPRRSSPPAARRMPSAPPAAAKPEAAGSTKTAPQETLLMGRSPLPVPQLEAPVHPPSPFFPTDSHAPATRAKKRAPVLATAPRSAPRIEPLPEVPREPQPPAPFFPPEPSLGAPDSAPLPSDPFRGTFPESVSSPFSDKAKDLSAPLLGPGPVSLEPDPVRSKGGDENASDESSESWSQPAATAGEGSDGLSPSPEAILLSLAQVGLYETQSAVVPAWEAAPRARPRRLWLAAAGILATLGIGFGGYEYASRLKAERMARAQELGTSLASRLENATKAELAASEAEFQTLFELDSRGREPALLWLENRVLHALFGEGPVSGIESALQRARAVGIEESRLVFGRLASALSAGDLPGAGQLIAEWDARSKDDAWYQLLAGAVLERAGNAEALARFEAAATLQPNLKLAQLMAARLGVLQLGPIRAKATLERAVARLGAGPASDVLQGLAWASSPTDAPAPARPAAASLTEYPRSLLSTHFAVEGVRALRENKVEEARTAFQSALGPNTTPALAAWIGYQALDAGDVETARTAALEAMKASAVHSDNKALAVRIALAEGRLAQAREAAATLDQSSREAILIEAVSAYESLRSSDVARLVASVGAGASNLDALRAGEKILLGQMRAQPSTLDQLAREQQVWGPLVAFDLALDQGSIEFAEKLSQGHRWDPSTPTLAVRLLRLQRVKADFAKALELIRPLAEPGNITPRNVTESVLALVDAGRVAAAGSHLAHGRDRSGDFAPWLEAIVQAAGAERVVAAKAVAKLELPSKAQPALLQAVALRALAAVKDKRTSKYYAQLADRLSRHPDVQIALAQLRAR